MVKKKEAKKLEKKEKVIKVPEVPKKEIPIKKIIYVLIITALLVSVIIYLILNPDLIKNIIKMIKEINITVPGVGKPGLNETQVSGLATQSMDDIKNQQDSLVKIQDLLSDLFK